MLKELRADSKLSTDSHDARPKAEPSHAPLNEGARKGERILKLLAGIDTVQGAGRRGKGSCRQGWELRILGRAAQAGRNRLRQVHVNRAQPEDNRCGFLLPSPGEPEDATAHSVGVGWHVGCHVSGLVNLCKQRSGHHIGVT